MSEAAGRHEPHATGASGPLSVAYFRADELRARAAMQWQQVLGVVCFGSGPSEVDAGAVPVASVATPVLCLPRDEAARPSGPAPLRADSAAELWQLPGAMRSGCLGRLHYRCGEQYLFACIALDERELLAGELLATGEIGSEIAALRAATETAYRELFGALERLAFPHPLRIWHFLPAINTTLGDGERYWHFNSARQAAFIGARRPIRGNVPAASMVGSEAGTALTIYCIAGREAPILLENPRQCAAWAYPAQYGPKSPTFARGCIDLSGDAPMLFLSGTASIVGHETAHVGDVAEQTRETLRNVRALVDSANARLESLGHRGRPFALERLRFKVYVRHPQDQPRIRQLLQQEARIEQPVLYLKADLCRRDLLLEVEASGSPVYG